MPDGDGASSGLATWRIATRRGVRRDALPPHRQRCATRRHVRGGALRRDCSRDARRSRDASSSESERCRCARHGVRAPCVGLEQRSRDQAQARAGTAPTKTWPRLDGRRREDDLTAAFEDTGSEDGASPIRGSWPLQRARRLRGDRAIRATSAALALLRAQARLQGQPSGSGRGRAHARQRPPPPAIAATIRAAPSQRRSGPAGRRRAGSRTGRRKRARWRGSGRSRAGGACCWA